MISRLDHLADRTNGAGDEAYDWVDERFNLDTDRAFLGKTFPAGDPFLLGGVALFCFLPLVLTGIFFGMFFEPSTNGAEYEGNTVKFQGQEVPEAFADVLYVTYDIPFGMFIRWMRHWAAHLFVVSIELYMLRVFFIRAHRNPCESNWVVGTDLADLSMDAVYMGYTLPFNEFAAAATGTGYNLVVSTPLVGGVVGKVFFGGELPSSVAILQSYFPYVLTIPVAIGGFLAVHMTIPARQERMEAPRDDDVRGLKSRDRRPVEGFSSSDGGIKQTISRDDDNVVVGLSAFPSQTAVNAAAFFLTLATLAVLARFLSVHNIVKYEPNNPVRTPELITPDWFLVQVYGLLRLLSSRMGFTVPLTGIHVPTEFVDGVLLSALVLDVVAIRPLADYRDESVHFTADPLDRLWQIAAGVAVIQLIMIASIAGMNSLLGRALSVGADVVSPILTVALFAVPVGSAALVHRVLDDSVDESRTGHVPGKAGDDWREHRRGSTATRRTLTSDVPTPRPHE